MNIVEKGPSPTILIVDDNPANLSVIVDYLADHGFRVMTAQTGKAGLELAWQVRPELILLDVLLPGIDGFEVCRRLKADDQTQEIPVIFMTVLTGVKDKVQGFEVGGVDYISKPFQEQEVVARVITHLRLRNLTGQLQEAKESLEKRVAERTAELAQANQELQAEIVERERVEEALQQSEQKKTVLSQIANVFLTVPDDEIYAEVLAIVLQVMESEFGLFGFIGANNDLVIPSLTRVIWNECQVPDKSIVFPPETWGDSLWGRAIREKKAFYSDGPFNIPTGHIYIDNFLAVPIVFGKETIGLLSVANRARGYTQEHKHLLEDITGYISPILNARLQRDQQEQERKLTEETLRASEQLLTEIAANYPHSYLSIIEKDLTVGFTSGQEFKKRNLDPKSFEGLTLEQVFGEHTPTVREHYLRTFQGEETCFELFTNNQHQLYQTVPLYDKNGHITRILSVVENITERKQAESELQRSNELLRAIIEAAPTAIIGLDLDGNVQTVWNPAAEKMLGWSAQEAMGRLLPSVPQENQEEFRRFRERIRKGLTLDGVDVHRQRRDGSPIDYSIYASPLRDAEGQVTGNIAVLVDITERKRAEEELKQHRDHLEELVGERTVELVTAKDAAEEARRLAEAAQRAAEAASQAKSAFLANMSHELRTPLNAILGYAQILQRRPLETDVIEALHTVRRSGEHLLTLINDILDIARIEVGKVKLSPAPFHFPSFLDHIASIIRARAEAKGLAFVFARLNELPLVVQADETRLRQVLLNLLDNAIKFTDAGQVTLRVQRISESANGPLADSPTRRLADSQICRFEVRDTGIGIPPGQWERIFQPFEQVEDLVRQSTGTGLGLAISRQLVRLMRGELHVHSAPGQGSAFWFEVALPVAEMDQVAARPSQQGIIGYTGPRRAVLVVDDVPSNRAVLVDLLAPLGFDVIEAADGQQALHLARELRPDLILMDRWMPVLNGFEATRRIRQMPELAQAPIIAISASVLEQDQVQSQKAGINAFLPKPVKWPDLAALLQEHLGLEWEYESASQRVSESAREEDAAMLAPPQEELTILLDLALRGNMWAIQERAVHIETLGEQYVPFARRLLELAKSFEEKQIMNLIERYVEEDQ